MDRVTAVLDHFPVVTFAFVVIALVGAVLSIIGDLSYKEYIDQVKDLGIGLGVIGAARGLSKLGNSPERNPDGKARR